MQPYKSIGHMKSRPPGRRSAGERETLNRQNHYPFENFHVLPLSGQMESRGNEPASSDGEQEFTPLGTKYNVAVKCQTWEEMSGSTPQ
ncbi:uncharacterized protein TrAFT101_007329 [Trichoderma asperellum]|uniref:uncharacterized protein n=1 Tax=Trichoderma asperellum TaxID=101201 RepID=UPI003329F1B3|nr:hypothetical protein TrAFT101_007329 [Trichoderma asperellum]